MTRATADKPKSVTYWAKAETRQQAQAAIVELRRRIEKDLRLLAFDLHDYSKPLRVFR
jgi:hypothetical protein